MHTLESGWTESTEADNLTSVMKHIYYLFVAIQLSLRNKLMDHLKKVPASPYRKQLKESQDSKELPECIVKLWLNISISKAWMEDHKAIVCETTNRKRSLKKGLKMSGLAD